MILIDAVFINNSGGKTLLDYFLTSALDRKLDAFYLLDSRYQGTHPELPSERVIYCKGSIIERHKFYLKHKNNFNKVFCFGNLPPTIKVSVPCYTYFHNVLFLSQPSDYPLKQRLIKKIKGWVLKYLKNNTDYFLLQSENVQSALLDYLEIPKEKTLLFPFYNNFTVTDLHYTRSGFIYVSNGNYHKNHFRLLKAWEKLSQNSITPELYLTITEDFPQLLDEIDILRSKGIKIFNLGKISREELLTEYQKRKFLIYPSLSESFGLGLIEAVEGGCEVLAADLPYSKAVIEPLNFFNPLEIESIADVVEKALNTNHTIQESRIKTENKINQLLDLLER